MATLAVCCISTVIPDVTLGKVAIGISFAPTVAYTGGTSTYLFGADPDAIGTVLSLAIQNQVKSVMSVNGVTFGLLDTVRVIPGVI